MTNAVIYARYSSHSQREESIDGQLRKCRAFAEENNFTIIGEYCDRALSGKTDNRAEFQRMIRDSEKGHFKAIIMYTLDRFARNRYDAATYKAKLRKNGVKLYYTEQSISDEPEGIILEAVLEGMAEYYSENLSRGVRRGMRENALKCLVNGGQTPLGYRKGNDKKYEINPATAPIVREIFDLYVNGKSQRQVVDILNEKGYRTARGKPFAMHSLETILTNKMYIGTYCFDDIEIKGGVPAIVNEDVFNTAQEMKDRNKRAPGRMKAPEAYLLTGKAFCGLCGSPITGESGINNYGTTYFYYKCQGKKKHHSCNKRSEHKDELERIVVRETVAKVLQPGIIDEISEKVAKLAWDEFNDKSRLLSLQTEQKEVQQSINNLLRLVEKGIGTDDIGDRLLELNAQKSDLQKQISKEERNKPLLTKEKISFWLTSFISNGNIDDKDYQERIINMLVNKVFIFDTDDGGTKIVITYNMSGQVKSTITLSDVEPFVNNAFFDGYRPPQPTNPNFFVVKHCFGIVIEIPDRL